jgi:CRP/FNR family cyclic AMP-dependent transcriptional regulator
MAKARAFVELLKAGRWFGALDEAFRDALLDAAVVRKLAKGERLFARGDAPNGLHGLAEGSIRITRTTPRGAVVLLALIEPPVWFGETSVFDGEPRTHDAIAGDDSSLVHVSQTALEAILAREPRYWRDLGALASARLRLVFAALEDAGEPIALRVARRLVLSAERYGDWHDRSSRVIDVRQEQLATMLSCSRQTVNQALKRFEARGLVRLSYGKVEILDLEGLREEPDRRT